MPPTLPRECISTTPTPDLAHRGPMSGSSRRADTSFTMEAPTAMAASATGALTVSIDSGMSGRDERRARKTGVMRRISSDQHRRSVGTSRLAADVEDIGAVGDELTAVRDGGVGRKKVTPVAEAVGGDVHYADHDRSAEGDIAAAYAPDQAGATSGPPRSGGADRRGSPTGIGVTGAGGAG